MTPQRSRHLALWPNGVACRPVSRPGVFSQRLTTTKPEEVTCGRCRKTERFRKESERLALIGLLRAAMEQPATDKYPAGPTTDVATVATRMYDTGLIRVEVGHA